MVGATAIVLFLGLLLTAVRVLIAAEKWGIIASATKRWVYVAVAVVGTCILIAGRSIVGSGTPDLPIKNLDIRVGAILATALLAGIPWIVLVSLAHDTCRLLRDRTESMPPLPLNPAAAALVPNAGADPPPHRDLIIRLLRLWDLLVLCVGTFALAVVTAIVTSSTLRAAFIQVYPARADEFPAVNVLYYGALFATLAAVLNLPLIAAWRSCARGAVDHAYPLPPDGQPSVEWVATRARMEALLHLDVSLLRNPLTALTILSPLLTSALTAFIPQISTA
jgi:hypothetical protein